MKKFKFDFSKREDMGFSFPLFLDAFSETFNKSSYNHFEKFAKENSNFRKWMVYSDYVLGDKRKPNDVLTFSFVPYMTDFDTFKKEVNTLSKRDIKDSKNINQNFLSFINELPIFSISIILNKNRKLCFVNEPQTLTTKNNMAIKQLKHWCRTTPEAKNNYKKTIGKLKLLNTEINRKGGNLKIIRNIEIIAAIVSYLIFEFSRIVRPDTIGWFSDRDDILNFKSSKMSSPIIYDLVHTYYYLLCQSDGFNDPHNPVLGIPEKSGKLWYDEFLRIPDCICGTIADYNIEKNEFSHNKFLDVLYELVASNEKHLLFKIDLSPVEFAAASLPIVRC